MINLPAKIQISEKKTKKKKKKASHGDRHLGMGACFHGHFFAIFLMVS